MIISVVIPTFKRPEMLERLLDSIARQTLLPREVIVIDDCSPDQESNLKVIHSYGQRIPSLRYLMMEHNSGAPSCRNRGILEASGDWVALVDDDDEWLENKLEEQVSLIQHSSLRNLGLVYTWADTVWPNGKIESHFRKVVEGKFLHAIIHECFIPSPSVLVKKQSLLDAGLFDPLMPSCQDWDMWVRIAERGHECACIKSVCTLYHKHEGESIGLSPKATKGYVRFYRKHFATLFKAGEWRHIIRALLFWMRQWRA